MYVSDKYNGIIKRWVSYNYIWTRVLGWRSPIEGAAIEVMYQFVEDRRLLVATEILNKERKRHFSLVNKLG